MKLIIFDLDQTLVDFIEVHDRVTQQTLVLMSLRDASHTDASGRVIIQRKQDSRLA
jgi:beta-phosphoglucomutase-like phosphatase (HAD superfamily)